MPPRVPLPWTFNLKKFPWKEPPRILTKQKVLELSKDYDGRARNVQRIARNRVEKGLQHAYKNRKVKRRNARKLWIERVNAGARLHGLQYSQLINGLKKCNVELNRKILTDLAINEPLSFAGICNHVRLRPDIRKRIYPAYGYVQSAVVTQNIVKPTKHEGTAHSKAFLKDEHLNVGEIVDHTNFRLPMYMDYIQIEAPLKHQMWDFRLQRQAEYKKMAQKKETEVLHKIHPESIITSRDVPRASVRKHWKFVKKEPYKGPQRDKA